MKNRKLWIFAAIVVAILILNHIFGWSEWLGNSDNLAFLSDLVEDNLFLAVVIYTVLTIVSCVVLALPGVTFAIIAGMIFGPVLGTICCSLATTLGAMIAFIAGRFFLKDSIKPAAEKNRLLKKWLFDETGKNEFFVLMITRLVPLFPYNLQNFAYGVTDISFATYSIGSLIFMLPGTAMYTIGFAGITDKEHRWLYIGIAVVLAIAVFGAAALLKKKYFSSEDVDPEAGVLPAPVRVDTSSCIHCGKCREACAFLGKNGIDIGDTEKLKELAFHCMLCGTCTSVCPVGIDGRDAVLSLRRERVHEGTAGIDAGGYGMLLREKRDYRYRNYKHAGSRSVLFPGCNFPSLYPKTTKSLADLLKETAGIETVYDCCGKPVAELGLYSDEEMIIAGIRQRLEESGTEEVIMVCPNCYYFLKDRLGIRVVSIYEKMSELGIGSRIPGGIDIFRPCPDRDSEELLRQIESDFAGRGFNRVEGVQCCGLGGSAGVKEPEIVRSMTDALDKEAPLYVYCASCAGQLARRGVKDVRHVLTEVLGTKEKPDTSKSIINRMLTRYK